MSEKKEKTRFQERCERWIRSGLLILTIVMFATVTVVPGVLRLMYRADSQVALGHAKSVRMAFQVAGTETYGENQMFCDITRPGGVTESVYKEVLALSKAPGDFWVLQTDETGYKVLQFVYREGEYTVWYQADPSSYTVYHDNTMINSKTDE